MLHVHNYSYMHARMHGHACMWCAVYAFMHAPIFACVVIYVCDILPSAVVRSLGLSRSLPPSLALLLLPLLVLLIITITMPLSLSL